MEIAFAAALLVCGVLGTITGILVAANRIGSDRERSPPAAAAVRRARRRAAARRRRAGVADPSHESGHVFAVGLNDFGQLGIGSSLTHSLAAGPWISGLQDLVYKEIGYRSKKACKYLVSLSHRTS
uniref:Uncharacterized protein n=1 Tax=Oryza glumipatula TaxID=40148 RepID=A0A0E0AZM9_9ORYZ